MTTLTYPFDPVGNNPLNRIVNEQHVLSSPNDARLYRFIIPSAAPFFPDSAVIQFRNPDMTIRTLVEGVDYYFGHHFISASKACAKPVVGSIQFLDRDIQGVLRLTYQTMGGVWTLSDQEIAEILANNLRNPRTTAWEQITELPFQFPVIDHEWNLVDMVGAKEIVEELESIREAILSASGGGLSQHVANRNNPHEVTATQVGLGLVQNYPLATTPQAQAGTNNTTYMTPLRTAQAIAAQVGAVVAVHADRTDNPHGVTKAQVGLGNVENYPLATNAIAITGTSTAHYMTPANTKAVTDLINAALANHVANHLNPHEVTKDQLMLMNVENYGIATAPEAQAGTANNKYMTPLRVQQAIAAQANTGLANHLADDNNPHNVTKAQVGLGQVQNYALASQLEAGQGTAGDKYMTPSLVKYAIDQQVKNEFTDHLNAENPHGVTKAQVGLGNVSDYGVATTAQAIGGVANNVYMTPQTTRAAIDDRAQALVDQAVGNITANDLDVYTRGEVDQAVGAKLDATAQAVDSALLLGNDLDDVSEFVLRNGSNIYVNNAISRVTAADPAVVGPDVWVHIAEITRPEEDPEGDWNPADPIPYIDLQCFITGGGALNSAEANGLYYLQISLRNIVGVGDQPTIQLRNLNGVADANFALGVVYTPGTIDNRRLSVYARVPNGYNAFNVINLHKNDGAVVLSDGLAGAEPAGIQYLSVVDPIATLNHRVDQLQDTINNSLQAMVGAISAI